MKQVVGLGLFGALFMASGVLILFVGIHLVVPAVLIIWLAVSVLLAGVTYVVQLINGEGGRLFFKRADGSLHPLSFLVYLPFMCSRYANLLLQRLVFPEPPLTEVDGGILVGGRIFPWDRRAMREAGVSAVLDVAAEIPRDPGVEDGRLSYMTVSVLDGSTPTVEQLAQGVDWTLRRLREHQTVLVQCLMGHGRSATFVAGVLLAQGRVDTIEEAVRLMRSKRSRIGLNRRQRRSLELALQNGALQPGPDEASSADPRSL